MYTFRHEIPDDNTLAKMGFRHIPRWFREAGRFDEQARSVPAVHDASKGLSNPRFKKFKAEREHMVKRYPLIFYILAIGLNNSVKANKKDIQGARRYSMIRDI